MKHIPTIAGILLGLLFLTASLTVLLHLAPMPPFPAGTAPAFFMDALIPTGYMTFVKVVELVGGLLLLFPRTRNFGLLAIGPVIVNILAFHTFIMKGNGLGNPMLIVIVLLAAYLLWSARHAFAGLAGNGRRGEEAPL